MAIILEKTFCTPAPIEDVWKLLSDPMRVVTCVPGAHITEKINGDSYKGSVRMTMGPSSASFEGTIQIVRIDEKAREIEILGRGKDRVGKGSASLKMTGKLRSLPDGWTEVTGVSEMNVVGLLAQIGSRVFSHVADFMFNEFTRNVQERLAKPD
ncbi:MAG TPA: SRPBCC family protein [Candidatus Saccharimonadales bacterium]|jgi:carbon monoxide dehydrogenase subunit G|nr:SRPBCC family protein [Candidatus Saccharimonadales bacterium]